MIAVLKRRLGRWLLAAYKRRKQKHAVCDVEHSLKSARRQMAAAKYVFLVTTGANGWPSARYVEPIVDAQSLEVWIATNPALRKIQEIGSNPKVTVAFGSERARANLVLYGTATLETDRATKRRYWRGVWRLFFPNGPGGEDYVLIRVRPRRIEVMDFSRNIIPEPFGLKPVVLEAHADGWRSPAPSDSLEAKSGEKRPG